MRFLIWRFNDFSSFQPKLIITLSVDLCVAIHKVMVLYFFFQKLHLMGPGVCEKLNIYLIYNYTCIYS